MTRTSFTSPQPPYIRLIILAPTLKIQGEKFTALTQLPVWFELYQRLPNSGQGLGNICFADHGNGRYLYVTNWDNGFIYKIDLDDWNGNPNSRANYNSFDIFGLDNEERGYAPVGQLLWGINYNPRDQRLYFGRWMQNGGELGNPNDCLNCQGIDGNTGLGPNTVHSVGLNINGQIALSDLRNEVILDRVHSLNALDTLISNPISDIAFSTTGKMLLTEKSMCCPDEVGGSNSRVLEYEFLENRWIRVEKELHIGAAGNSSGSHSSGGIDYGYHTFDPNNFARIADCDSIIWATADIEAYNTYGLAGIPISGNDSDDPNAYFIDLADNFRWF